MSAHPPRPNAEEAPARRAQPSPASRGAAKPPRRLLAPSLLLLAVPAMVALGAGLHRLLPSESADLCGGLAVLWGLAAWLCALGLRASRHVSRRTGALLAAPAMVVIALHSFVLIDEPRLAWLLPVSSLVVLGNVAPLGVGWLAGVAWHQIPRPLWRRLVFIVPMVLITAWQGYGWMFEVPPRCGNFRADGMTLQTSQATCSAAAAATLLRDHGIETTEAEMARLCLTRDWGTTRLGLYRGLTLKTHGTPYRVEVFDWTLDELRAKPPGPVVLHVVLERDATDDPRYERDWGWEPGRAHAVIVFRFLPDDLVEMGDPSIGRELWRVDSLRVLWHGDGMRLVKR